MAGVGARMQKRKRPPSARNDAYEQVNQLMERYRPPMRVESDEWGNRAGGAGGPAGNREDEFPVHVNRPNRDRDTRLRTKSEYVSQRNAGGAGNVDLGEPHFDDKDLEAYIDIDRQRQQISFESWLSSYFDVSDPATAKIVSDIYPEYWSKREAAIKQQAQLQTDLALIRLRGPQTKKDLMTLYAASTGAIPIPAGAVFEPQKWSLDNSDFNRGMLNPRRYYAAGVIANKRDPIGALIAMRGAGAGGAAPTFGNGHTIGRLDRPAQPGGALAHTNGVISRLFTV